MRRDPGRYRGALLPRARWEDLGYHPRDLAGPDFTRVYRGFHTPTDHPASLNAMAFVLQHRVLPGCVISHTTAALLLGVPFSWALDGGVAFLRPGPGPAGSEPGDDVPLIPSVRPGQSLRTGARLPLLHARIPQGEAKAVRRGVHVHRWEPGPVLELGDLVVSAPVEVLRELATMLPLYDLVAAVDGVLSAAQPLARVGRADISRHLELMSGHRGVTLLREALALAREDVRSPGESPMHMLVLAAGLPEPDPNLPVTDPVTGQRRLLDLAWQDAGFALEYDGDGHRTTKEQWREDEARRDELAALGWTLARANGWDALRPLRILRRLARALRERGSAVPSDEHIARVVAALPSRGVTLQLERRRSGYR